MSVRYKTSISDLVDSGQVRFSYLVVGRLAEAGFADASSGAKKCQYGKTLLHLTAATQYLSAGTNGIIYASGSSTYGE